LEADNVVEMPDGTVLDVDSATPEALRAGAQKWRAAAAKSAAEHAWAMRYAPPAPEPSGPTMAGMVAESTYQPLTAEERAERDQMLRKARALAQIEHELEKEERAAAQTKAEEERAAARHARRVFRPAPTIQQILRRR
jgi:hypothetical protein